MGRQRARSARDESAPSVKHCTAGNIYQRLQCCTISTEDSRAGRRAAEQDAHRASRCSAGRIAQASVSALVKDWNDARYRSIALVDRLYFTSLRDPARLSAVQMRPQTASPHAGLHTSLRRRAHERRRAAAAASNLTRRQEEEEQLTAAAFYVPHLLGVPADSTLKLYSGLIPSSPPEAPDKTDAHLFFVLARNRHIADKERLIIWFNGGPGCSSFDGFLMEIGPLRTVPGSTTGELREVDGAWNEYASASCGRRPS